jgi:hypothetical protein
MECWISMAHPPVMAGSPPRASHHQGVPYVGWGRSETTRRHHQQALATARAVCHRSQLELAGQGIRRQRRQGIEVGPLAWFAVQGVIDDHVVRALWSDGRLRGARLLVDRGVEFRSDDPPRRYRASLPAPPVACC